MRRSASQILRNLEMRIARLERQSSNMNWSKEIGTITALISRSPYSTDFVITTGEGRMIESWQLKDWHDPRVQQLASDRGRSLDRPFTDFSYDSAVVISKGRGKVPSKATADKKIISWMKNSGMRAARLEKQSSNGSQREFIQKWNRSGNYSDLEKAGLADAYDELYSLTLKEEERGELSSSESRRYVDLYDLLTKKKVEIRFGVNI